ncbi:bifunctional proline dehydrogenase/pyrroline-5-carboxylate dehydrogenase [Marinomonas aquimarina]|uniref:Bifunctional proline dehydrogenase/pyrroline-5-carboxylate dehydrogenase n=1 Tax=Marinomonas aquimarina TaxID=295068 RepID=A0A1A8TD23_9GAMM|nr:1-pyrroline-5-carboxylate dehydrogenase [Marinomonas aquimarina]SBS31005.1 bifunctional proline dehydrogenase/pyrroline-5-carboxylate dehydrogenase [Marinomonas aquimarina]
MTIVKPIQIDVANQVFEAWNTLGVQGRAEKLEQAIYSLSHEQAQMARWQLANARHEIGAAQVMPGPTGESNVLSTHGRGAFLTAVQAGLNSEQASVGLIGQMFAALVAGNPIITVGPEGQALMDQLAKYVPQGVIQNIAESARDSIVEASDLAGVAIICDPEKAQQLSQQLAQKPGLLCQLVEETDLVRLSTIAAPNYILRFVTEQTVSTNTTAIGGNATLLELGSKAE